MKRESCNTIQAQGGKCEGWIADTDLLATRVSLTREREKVAAELNSGLAPERYAAGLAYLEVLDSAMRVLGDPPAELPSAPSQQDAARR